MSHKMHHQQPSYAAPAADLGWLRALRTSVRAGIMVVLCALPGLAQAQSARVVVTAPAVRVVAPPPPVVVVQQPPVVVAPPPRPVYVPPPRPARVVVVAPRPRPQRVVVVREPVYGPGRGWKHGWKRGHGWRR